MWQLRKHPRLYRDITACLLLLFVQACVHWKTMPLKNLPAGEKRVRATLHSNLRVNLTSPFISGDSLMSHEADGIPLARISWIEVRRLDPVATGFVVIVSGVFLAIAASKGALGPDRCTGGC